jgi:hypothetical protein
MAGCRVDSLLASLVKRDVRSDVRGVVLDGLSQVA